MDLKKTSYLIILLLVLMSTAFFSCKGKQDVFMANDSILVVDSFKKSNGELCKITIKVVASYPIEYKDEESTEKLQQLFCQAILGATEGQSDVKEAMNYYAKSLIAQNSSHQVNEESEVYEEDYDVIDVDNFELTIKISSVYNDKDLLSFNREETVIKNDQVTSVTHTYVNFDLQSMKKVTLGDLFLNENQVQITQMLKSKLMEDQGAKDEDELNQLGYYNLPNLSVTNNFYFSDKGITWSYEPNVIAVPAVGETTIMLPISDLKRYNYDSSLLNRF